jgi:predicted Co/Zn/Cd cation transporter (cation efflux family)
MEMDSKFLIRYIILLVVLLICAGLAWYLTTQAQVPSDAVLAGGVEPWIMEQCI